jgi:hypothetical protein
MKLLPLLGTACLALASSCVSQGPYVNKHWSERSVGPSMARAFLGYNPEFDGSYRDFAWAKKASINTTIRRHFFNHNPDNPFQTEDKSLYGPRPNNSLVPHPENYIHYEGLIFGAISLGFGNVFTPIPIDSVIGTFEPGGGDEFAGGFHEFFEPLAVVTTSFFYGALGFTGDQHQEQSYSVIVLEDGSQATEVMVAEPAKN